MNDETGRPEWDDAEQPESPALLPLAIQLAQERLPMRVVRPSQNPEEAYRELLAAARTSWQEQYDRWLRDSREQCWREGDTGFLVGPSARARWIPWDLHHASGTFALTVLDATAELLLRQALPPEQTLETFDEHALRLIEETKQYKLRRGRQDLFPLSDGLLKEPFDALEREWADPHAFIIQTRTDLERMLWPTKAQQAHPGLLRPAVPPAKAGTREEIAEDRRNRVTDFLARANQVSGVARVLTREHLWRCAGYDTSRDFYYWQSAHPTKATKASTRNFERLLGKAPEEFVMLLREKGLID